MFLTMTTPAANRGLNWGIIPVLILGITATLEAAPKLRLNTTTVGPVSIAQGANANQQTIEASNAGDGDLSLQVTTSVPWISTSLGGQRVCALQFGTCTLINIAFNTASLARGTHTGTVTVTDPNALDAPQNVTVTVQVGGGVPDAFNLYVAPNGSSDEARFITNSNLLYSANTQSGGNWLSVALDGTGTFRFAFPYRVLARHQEAMPEGTYNGTVIVSGSPVAAENKSVPVRLVVTSQPIARSSAQDISFRVATGASVQQFPVSVFNGGMGTLSVSSATASTASGGNWLSVEAGDNFVVVKADPASVPLGTYTGTVTINTNAANAALTLPVRLEMIAPAPPVAAYTGVLNSANFDQGLAPGGVAAIFGEQFSFQEAAQGTSLPLGQTLGGVRVLVNDQPAPLFFSSYNQVNFQIPYETAAGEAVISVERDGTPGNRVAVLIAPRAPRIIQSGNAGVIVNSADGTLVTNSRPIRPGGVITIYAVGLGAPNGNIATGTAAPASEPLARITPAPRVVIGNAFSGVVAIDPFYVGLTPSLVGLYQINVQLPADLIVGDMPLALEGDGYRSNAVILPIRQ